MRGGCLRWVEAEEGDETACTFSPTGRDGAGLWLTRVQRRLTDIPGLLPPPQGPQSPSHTLTSVIVGRAELGKKP